MKIPTQIWIFCVGIFLQHYTFLQKRTFCILCENFSRFVRKATVIKEQLVESGFDEKLISNFEIKPLNAKKTVVYHYKNYIECSLGSFSINADKSVINYLLKSGIGSRKSAGFGFAELLSEGGEPN